MPAAEKHGPRTAGSPFFVRSSPARIARTATPAPPATTSSRRGERRMPARLRRHAERTSGLFLFFQLAALALDQHLQLVQQLRIVCAQCIDQIGERQLRLIRGTKQLADALDGRAPLKLLQTLPRRIAERPALRHSIEQSL